MPKDTIEIVCGLVGGNLRVRTADQEWHSLTPAECRFEMPQVGESLAAFKERAGLVHLACFGITTSCGSRGWTSGELSRVTCEDCRSRVVIGMPI